jgi:hypothetical protein
MTLSGMARESGKQLKLLEGGERRWQQVEEAGRQLKEIQGQSLLGKIAVVNREALLPEGRAVYLALDL